MNDDFEERLRTVRRAPPSAELDQRMERAFLPPRQSNRRWWLAALPAAAAAVALVLVFSHSSSRRVATSGSPVIYQIEPSGLMREWLLTPPARAQTPPPMVVTMQP
jgi:hypothetical protein